ncbi:MAG: tetratricopeptide repeat protein [Kiritimatiellia bacterium]
MRKYYDEDDEDYGQETRLERRLALLPMESLLPGDWLIALVLGAGVFLALTLFPFPGLAPDVWNDASVAAGLRPPATLFPGLWRVIARGIYLAGGFSGGTAGLLWAGRVCAALTAAGAYLLLRSVLALLVRRVLRYAVRRIVVQRVAAGLGALFFACGDSVWRAGQTFTFSGLLMLLTVVQLCLFARFLLNGQMLSGLGAVFLLGVIVAETPVGMGLLVGCGAVYLLALRRGALCANMPLLDPVFRASAMWRLTLVGTLGLIAGVALNCTSFIEMGGLVAAGKAGEDMPLMYLLRWWNMLTQAESPMGWALGLGVCVLPMLVAMVLLPRAVDEEQFLPYHVGGVFFFTGMLAFTQLCMLPPLWFWTWSSAVTLGSAYLQQLLMLSAAATVTFALTSLGVDVCCRNHARLAAQHFAELHEGDAGGASPAPGLRRGGRSGLVFFFVVCALLVVGVLPGRRLLRTRVMLGIVEDYVKEVVAECGPVRWIFTDGSFDARLELEAASQGRKLSALSMMADNAPYQQYLRKRGVTDAEDLMSLSMGAPMVLRSWMRDKSDRQKEMAVQLGFELWKREGRELPACSGVLARPAGMDAAACDAGVERTRQLADRILDLYVAGGLERASGRTIRELFLFVQWRIARLARMRAERADRAGDVKLAMRDVKLSDQLDGVNESLQRILASAEKAKATTLKQVTPREGLQLALTRADFVLARRYGEVILEADPDDPNANFGVGMSYYSQGQWTRAEEYLRRCLTRKPKEPAVWNNLAMICLHENRFDEAERHARKALEIIPESAEVKDTLKRIADARESAAAERKDAGRKPTAK